MSGQVDWAETARLVSVELARRLPSSDGLSPEQRIGDPQGYRSHLLYSEPGGAFSIVALVWRPGQVTPIHDHVTWCVFCIEPPQGAPIRRNERQLAGRSPIQ